jgi:nicotinate-nucleotide adenylyltransferase
LTSSRARKSRASGRSIALFGGTFDPVHSGHLAVASAVQRRFELDAIYFVPSSRPPHKTKRELAPFAHRYAMVVLACAGHPGFLPSLVESDTNGNKKQIYYSIDTVGYFQREYPGDRLYFILGADSFLEIQTWKDHEALLDSCDFIIASRPGFPLDELRHAIPTKFFKPTSAKVDRQTIALRKSMVHLLPAVRSHVSSTDVRERLKRGESIHGLVPQRIEDYILQQALYR